MTQQLSFFDTPKPTPYIKPVWSPWGRKRDHKRDSFEMRCKGNPVMQYWQPQGGDIVNYYGEYALVDGVTHHVGMFRMFYVLEVIRDAALVYYPEAARYAWEKPMLGLVSLADCYPASIESGFTQGFVQTQVDENISAIYPGPAATRRNILEKICPPKDLFDIKK